MQKHKIYICIDDTDELGYYKSTGEISEEIKEFIEEKFNIECSLVTRHQLFIHESIPYTSHNSSMCFTTYLSLEEKEKVKDFVIEYIKEVSAASSAPGVCFAFEKDIVDVNELIKYGLDAKTKVLTKDEAYSQAKRQNIDLSEHKNNGDGIIGALAGVALRLYGSDGRVKGKLKPKKAKSFVSELLEYEEIDEVRFEDGNLASLDLEVETKTDLKMVYLKNKYVLLIENKNDIIQVISKENLKRY